MIKTLDTLIKLAEADVDERRLELKAIQDKEDHLLAQKKALAEKVENEKAVAADSIEAGFAFTQFAQWAREEQKRLDLQIENIQPELEHARNNLSEAFAEQKKVEITRDRREEEMREEEKAREQAFLDEFTTNQFIRKQK